VTRRQNFEEYMAVLYAAIRKHGCPTALVSDHGGVFRDHRAVQIYTALGIEKKEIEKRQAWQNYVRRVGVYGNSCMMQERLKAIPLGR